MKSDKGPSASHLSDTGHSIRIEDSVMDRKQRMSFKEVTNVEKLQVFRLAAVRRSMRYLEHAPVLMADVTMEVQHKFVRARERSERKEGISFCGGSWLLSEASTAKEPPSAAEAGKRAKQHKEGVSFCGGSGRASEASERRRVLLQRTRTRSASAKKACPSAAEAGERAKHQKEGVCFCSGCRLAQQARRRRVLLRRKRAASLGGCQGETPPHSPAAGEAEHARVSVEEVLLLYIFRCRLRASEKNVLLLSPLFRSAVCARSHMWW
jgi:hypothetical protein